MSLLRTRAIRVGTLLAFTADPTAMNGVSLMWGNPERVGLSRGDMVQVLTIEVGDGTTWAKVQVLVLRGKAAGRVCHVSIDLGQRLQRCWQALTVTGSMAPMRVHKNTPQAFTPQPPTSGTRVVDVDDLEACYRLTVKSGGGEPER